MESKSYRQYLGLWTLEERRNRQDFIELFKIFKGISRNWWTVSVGWKHERY